MALSFPVLTVPVSLKGASCSAVPNVFRLSNSRHVWFIKGAICSNDPSFLGDLLRSALLVGGERCKGLALVPGLSIWTWSREQKLEQRRLGLSQSWLPRFYRGFASFGE